MLPKKYNNKTKVPKKNERKKALAINAVVFGLYKGWI